MGQSQINLLDYNARLEVYQIMLDNVLFNGK